MWKHSRDSGHVVPPALVRPGLQHEANASVAHVLKECVSSGRQQTMHVVAYHRGECIIDVSIGDGRTAATQAPTLFMSYSVCKGVCSIALLTLADKGIVDFCAPVTKYWPEYGVNNKHRTTVAEAVSHRAGVLSTPPVHKCVHAVVSGGWKGLWELGMSHTQDYVPDYAPGDRCVYHPVSWSWLIGGISQRASGSHIHSLVGSGLTKALDIPTDDMHVGRLPPSLRGRVNKLIPSPAGPFSGRGPPTSSTAVTYFDRLRLWLFGWLEARIATFIGNSVWWSRLCLPSSNGYFTADAVARAYGALANGGRVTDANGFSRELVNANTVQQLKSTLQDETLTLPPSPWEPTPSRLSMGFSPWPNERIHGRTAHVAIGHSGVGGCTAFADLDGGLSVCVMKNVYEPYSIYGTVSPDVAHICKVIRDNV